MFKEVKNSTQVRETSVLLSAQFLRTGMKSARQALEIFIADPDDIEGVALHSGIAVEAWCKASLAGENPILLIDRRTANDATLRILSGVDGMEGAGYELRTIGGVEVCHRMSWIHPHFPYISSDKVVFEARNAAAHGGIVEQQASLDALRVMVKVVNWICCNDIRFKNGVPYALWEEQGEAAERLDQSQLKENGIRARARIESAHRSYSERFSTFDQIELRRMSSQMSPPHPADEFSFPISYECPACRNPGWLYCEEVASIVEGGSGETRDREDSISVSPLSFRCQLCGLELESAELGAIDMGESLEVPAALLVYRLPYNN
ncbi:hypothetical protein [Pseudonocardia kunmingensis]|uniref:Uncharacterized protein n=1 Tax=Pseudonocardia kunmingensis TaxID=630975 RepID=A0A543DNK6_9PSEU|nr:hypothetical protein [Pseudonocardia kunmingensis]TQM10921.1 hypothetical protein FB558_3445 [Pseudonocardia kunmingensis]